MPDDEVYIRDAESLAASGSLRAYILFDGSRPVSYLYCPARDGVLMYAYLGYDPEYMKMSVGTVLQWLALEQIFSEGKFTHFDFTEGESAHKRLFSTHQRKCANGLFLEWSARNYVLLYLHLGMDRTSRLIGQVLDRFSLKSRVKRVLRFSRRART